MGIRWKTFEMPKRLEVDKDSLTPTYGKFVAEPFERGYGTTIGNSLRRVLISSIDGAAITSIKIDGMLHEFGTLDGVVEDGAQIVLNIKTVIIRYYGKGPKTLYLNAKKEGVVTAADIKTDETVQIVNPDQVICTLSKAREFKMELEVDRGRGYVPADRNKSEDMAIGVVAVDSLYSPVVKVNYWVEDTRVGQMTDYDKLTFEIWTNGAMGPEEAMLYASNILQRHLDIFVNYGEIPEEEEEEEEDNKEFRDMIAKPISELELSVRSANCLEAANIKTIGDLIRKGEPQMLKYKNFGKKSLNEIGEILVTMGLSLGMDVDSKLEGKPEAAPAEETPVAEDKPTDVTNENEAEETSANI
jgi:DNA-directed RNA polymerase subunit alpha